MWLKLTTDRYPRIASQARYPLRHAAFLYMHFTLNIPVFGFDDIQRRGLIGHFIPSSINPKLIYIYIDVD